MLRISLLYNGSIITRIITLGVRLSNKFTTFQNKTILVDQWMLVMSTQLIGFSIGGICRRFLVNPPSMSMFVSVPKQLTPESCNSLARQFGHMRAIQHASCSDIRWHGSTSWYQPREVLLLYLFSVRHLVLCAGLFVPSTQLLLLGVLDCTRQYSGQRDVWLHPRNGYELDHI